ncbi:MAG: hypothetical protein IKD72_02915, partial [Clostridia bacterium]|nr:hypothetical protein [Clostridia bacterium]
LPAAGADAEEPLTERCELYAENHLTQMGYSDLAQRTELAVGDTLEVIYDAGEEADVLINGTVAEHLKAGEHQIYFYEIKETGTVEIAVVCDGADLIRRSFTVIKSAEMYRKVLREAFRIDFSALLEPIDISDAQGFPFGNPFLPLAMIVTAMVNAGSLLFAATRIIW